jgi:hypothetical protein
LHIGLDRHRRGRPVKLGGAVKIRRAGKTAHQKDHPQPGKFLQNQTPNPAQFPGKTK